MKHKKTTFIKKLLSFTVLIFFIIGCKDETFSFSKQKIGNPHDPTKPITITKITPNEGFLREKVIIYGSNFGNDVEKTQVFFVDTDGNERTSPVVSVHGESIYCLAPRQITGESNVKVIINENKEAVSPVKFSYTARENVSWVALMGKSLGVGARYEDGSLADAHMWRPHAITSIGNNQFMTFGFYENLANKVRLISIDDDRVITVQEGVYLGQAAINESKTRVYATTLNPPHTIFEYKKEGGWTPYKIGELVVPKYTSCCDRIRALVMMDEAHDPNQEWLYFAHKNKTFGRYNINTEETEIIADETLDVPVKDWAGYLVYDKFQNCFYLSLYESYSIYKITKTGDNWGDGVKAELYVGSPSRSEVTDGHRENARFKQPMGMCMDEEGNLFITDRSAHVIRKLSAKDEHVTTIAGVVNVEGAANGDPKEATFFFPIDIDYDGDGGFYIAEDWESSIRKYSIE